MKDELSIINERWHNERDDDRYIHEIEKCERIEVYTSLANRYFFYRTKNKSDPSWDKKWIIEKNGVKATEPHWKSFSTMDDFLLPFYETIDPITKRPVEVPLDVNIK